MESQTVLAQATPFMFAVIAVSIFATVLLLLALPKLLLGLSHIPSNRVGVIEKLWSLKGSVTEGRIMALRGEAGYQAEILRGGIHFFYWPWQYRVHKMPLTTVSQGKIGYVFARDGQPLSPQQTLARVADCDNFQDARAFLCGRGEKQKAAGQRGRQRAILREGVYAINPALFVVITEESVYRLRLSNEHESQSTEQWRKQLALAGGFDPVVVGRRQLNGDQPSTDDLSAGDDIGIVTVHDGPSLQPGQIIAPPAAANADDANYHNNYQDVEAFLRAGGRRGRQFAPLTDGTYFINRWFATVELIPKTVVPIGNVGVVVSYYGGDGSDVSGVSFRHGERVGEGERGVQAKTLGPGKYAFNTYAGRFHLAPTTNFVLHWITGRTEAHRFDESLKSIDLVTADAYEPVLPLSVVVHIDYQKAASVVQRFGDVKKLITQTLDPMLSAYFRDIAHKKTMLELLHERDAIQREAREELRGRFADFDIELVDVLIGKPNTEEASGQIETLLEQLRLRQLSREQIETYQEQSAAAEKLKSLKMTQALADKQTELTDSEVQIKIAENQGQADLAQSRKRAEQSVVTAEAQHKCDVLSAEAESKAKALLGEGEGRRVALEGEAHAQVLRQKIGSFGDPKLFAISLVAQRLARSCQPLVPEQMFVGGSASGNGDAGQPGLLGVLIDLLVAEKLGHTTNGRDKEQEAAQAIAVGAAEDEL